MFSIKILTSHLFLESGKIYEDLKRWMIAATDTFEDKSNQERFENQPNWCRLIRTKPQPNQEVISSPIALQRSIFCQNSLKISNPFLLPNMMNFVNFIQIPAGSGF
jgi:hypothetical protein